MPKKPIPPEDVIREESEPSRTEMPEEDPNAIDIDIDDAQIEEPKDDAFRKSAQPVKAQGGARKPESLRGRDAFSGTTTPPAAEHAANSHAGPDGF